MFQEDLVKMQKLLKLIPKGKVTTYGILAAAMDIPRGWRYVGYLLKSNPDPEKYPCYKVVRSNGEVGGYSVPRGAEEKIRRLGKDNVTINNGRIVNFRSKIFNFSM